MLDARARGMLVERKSLTGPKRLEVENPGARSVVL